MSRVAAASWLVSRLLARHRTTAWSSGLEAARARLLVTLLSSSLVTVSPATSLHTAPQLQLTLHQPHLSPMYQEMSGAGLPPVATHCSRTRLSSG